MDLKTVIRVGAIFSVIGIILLIGFISTLLLFPVNKKCQNTIHGCEFYSIAPEPLASFIKPVFLVLILLIIAAGVAVIRFGRWREYKKDRNQSLSFS